MAVHGVAGRPVDPQSGQDPSRYTPEAPVGGRPLAGWRLVVDPGHGGCDAGDVVGEAVWALQVGAALTERCQAMGAEVLLTRWEDRYVPRLLRRACAAEWRPSILLSVHAGAPHSRSAAVLRFGCGRWRRRGARRLAGHLLEAVDQAVPARPMPWTGWRHGACVCPPAPWPALALLVIVHPPADQDRAGSITPERWADALARGIATYGARAGGHFALVAAGAAAPTSLSPAGAERPAAAPPPAPGPPPAGGSASLQSMPLVRGQRHNFRLAGDDAQCPSKR